MKTTLLLAALILSSAWAAPATAQDDAPSPHLNLGEKNLAMQGYDLVAYLEENEARQGNPEHTFRYQGAVYHFVSEANKNTFAEHPEQYLPQYGGWCAFGLGMDPDAYGYPQGKYSVDPMTFKVVEGKLYLFYNQDGFNALEHWNRDEATTKQRADTFWMSLKKEDS